MAIHLAPVVVPENRPPWSFVRAFFTKSLFPIRFLRLPVGVVNFEAICGCAIDKMDISTTQY